MNVSRFERRYVMLMAVPGGALDGLDVACCKATVTADRPEAHGSGSRHRGTDRAYGAHCIFYLCAAMRRCVAPRRSERGNEATQCCDRRVSELHSFSSACIDLATSCDRRPMVL
ncbi:hypothetical protein BN2475_720067 [Paraburkholderia ribeironis]|uniref:Uncharacterized protein n=1 Tax=Paraburkholderia ribeironis TaxID=1247936 RepID=A0A1N7SIW8_9BURK|nr:hypothetical protein BN2475_720067 [Paraburkholderia ribeironis]